MAGAQGCGGVLGPDSDQAEAGDVALACGLLATQDHPVTVIRQVRSDEMEMLKAEANAMQVSLAAVQKRIAELENTEIK